MNLAGLLPNDKAELTMLQTKLGLTAIIVPNRHHQDIHMEKDTDTNLSLMAMKSQCVDIPHGQQKVKCLWKKPFSLLVPPPLWKVVASQKLYQQLSPQSE